MNNIMKPYELNQTEALIDQKKKILAKLDEQGRGGIELLCVAEMS